MQLPLELDSASEGSRIACVSPGAKETGVLMYVMLKS